MFTATRFIAINIFFLNYCSFFWSWAFNIARTSSTVLPEAITARNKVSFFCSSIFSIFYCVRHLWFLACIDYIEGNRSRSEICRELYISTSTMNIPVRRVLPHENIQMVGLTTTELSNKTSNNWLNGIASDFWFQVLITWKWIFFKKWE